ncbi:MAG: holdfast anchoring protein HfaA [Pseudomonadota bacterium]
MNVNTRNRLTWISAALVVGLACGGMHGHAAAQEASALSAFERPYGFGYGQESQPFSAGTRDPNGNRVIVNGLIEGGSGLGLGLNTGWGQTSGAAGLLGGPGSAASGNAVGNQLNVITNGSYNTIIIDSTQINSGDQTVSLNGEIDLND